MLLPSLEVQKMEAVEMSETQITTYEESVYALIQIQGNFDIVLKFTPVSLSVQTLRSSHR
jgi:hypothetical protein